LFSAVIFLYLLFSPVGLVGGVTDLFWLLVVGLLGLNVAGWWLLRRRPPTVYS
jgi:SSS family solute:Na+ symporter